MCVYVCTDINFFVFGVCAAEQPFLCGLPSALDFINTLFCLACSQRRLKCTEKIGRLFHHGGSFRGGVGHTTDQSHLFLLDQEAVNHPRPSCKRPKELVSRLGTAQICSFPDTSMVG